MVNYDMEHMPHEEFLKSRSKQCQDDHLRETPQVAEWQATKPWGVSVQNDEKGLHKMFQDWNILGLYHVIRHRLCRTN